jgi:hypothetical protein
MTDDEAWAWSTKRSFSWRRKILRAQLEREDVTTHDEIPVYLNRLYMADPEPQPDDTLLDILFGRRP